MVLEGVVAFVAEVIVGAEVGVVVGVGVRNIYAATAIITIITIPIIHFPVRFSPLLEIAFQIR
ncbi:MAG: hypothetical protein DRN78_06020 [Thermoproteota archaeon]|nr:MAG: hypothetical protein DRN78_06020 [Candidatus Korarchaeota archaeon]